MTRPRRSSVARQLVVFMAACLAAAPALGAPAPAREPPPRSEPTRIYMKDVVLFPFDDTAAAVRTLSGTVRPDRPPAPIWMDDVTSYRVDVEHAEVRLAAEDLSRLMNAQILRNAQSPIKHVDVSLGDGVVSMSGTMVKLGAPVPFTATATVAPTQGGDLRVHVTSMRAAGIVPKGLLDALGMELSNVAQPANRSVFHIEGDDMIVPVVSMFPPPRFNGRLSSVAVTPSGMEAVIGKAGADPVTPGRGRQLHLLQGWNDQLRQTDHARRRHGGASGR